MEIDSQIPKMKKAHSEKVFLAPELAINDIGIDELESAMEDRPENASKVNQFEILLYYLNNVSTNYLYFKIFFILSQIFGAIYRI